MRDLPEKSPWSRAAAVVKQFASQGADVAVVYAGNQELAEALCAQCAADYGVKAIAYRCDVADFAAVKDTVNQVKKDFGSVDILVNNAGITQDGLLARRPLTACSTWI